MTTNALVLFRNRNQREEEEKRQSLLFSSLSTVFPLGLVSRSQLRFGFESSNGQRGWNGNVYDV
ncbi:hypothetical protein G4B88_023503 [Cannabis sativa]|uniref:Uncharacterized protein n=1 Tax=Cannabis sativa TaxID=3483 RepID=A0A7J6HVT5_CANSA|nr:hypothetical protein G4B88_023503 [Cannabis sativa]